MQSAPALQDVTQLKSFLGLVDYYGKFLPDLSSLLSPERHEMGMGRRTKDEVKALLT